MKNVRADVYAAAERLLGALVCWVFGVADIESPSTGDRGKARARDERRARDVVVEVLTVQGALTQSQLIEEAQELCAGLGGVSVGNAIASLIHDGTVRPSYGTGEKESTYRLAGRIYTERDADDRAPVPYSIASAEPGVTLRVGGRVLRSATSVDGVELRGVPGQWTELRSDETVDSLYERAILEVLADGPGSYFKLRDAAERRVNSFRESRFLAVFDRLYHGKLIASARGADGAWLYSLPPAEEPATEAGGSPRRTIFKPVSREELASARGEAPNRFELHIRGAGVAGGRTAAKLFWKELHNLYEGGGEA